MPNPLGWNGWSWYWLEWFVEMFAVRFLVPELWQLWSGHSENSFSAQVWRIEGVNPGMPQSIFNWSFAHYAVGGILALLLIWLIGHFVFGLWH